MSIRIAVSADSERTPFLLRNQTPTRLEIVGAQRTLKLAPLQQVRVPYRPDQHLGPAAIHAYTDRAVVWEREPIRSTRVWATAWLVLIGAVSLVAALLAVWSGIRGWWLAVVAVVVAVTCVTTAVGLNRFEMDADPVTGALGAPLSGWRFTRDVLLSALQKLALATVLAVGILGPTLAIYYGSELPRILSLANRFDPELIGGASTYPIVVARVLQLVLVVTLSLIPGLMYFQFDREKLTTLMDRWVHHAFRLDPTLHTIADVDAKYGRRVEEFYGASFDSGIATAKKRMTTTRSPLYVTTLLLAVGWVVVLLKTSVGSGSAAQELVFGRFLEPALTPMTCAFLGAYFFAVQVVLLGYVRGDLRPKTYNVVAVRIVVSVILAWMLQGLFGSDTWVLAVSFLGGLVPDTVLRYIRDIPTRVTSARGPVPSTSDPDSPDAFDELDDRSPLTALDGIGIYERTRLAEEGITSIQALARHDLVDLMLSSRIPASRLIDWLDQALLYQHVTTGDRQRLRHVGIRTATELLGASRSTARARLNQVLEDGERRMPLILTALRGDEWLTYVMHWRSHDDTQEPGRTRYTDQGLDLVTEAPTGNGHMALDVAMGKPPV